MISTVSDILGFGKIAGSTAGKAMDMTVALRGQEMENRRVRAVERETTTRKKFEETQKTARKQIQASVDKTQIIEKYKTNRAKSFNELGYRYINESDEILTADDRPWFYHEERKGNKHTRLAMSNHNFEFLFSNFLSLLYRVDPIQSAIWVNQQVWCKQQRQNKMDKMEFMARTAAAGDLQFTLPDQWGESPNDGAPPPPLPEEPPPPPPTPEEIEEQKREQQYIDEVEQRLSEITGEGAETALTSDDTPGLIDNIKATIKRDENIRKKLINKGLPVFGTKKEKILWNTVTKNISINKRKLKEAEKEYKALKDEVEKNKKAHEDTGAR